MKGSSETVPNKVGVLSGASQRFAISFLFDMFSFHN